MYIYIYTSMYKRSNHSIFMVVYQKCWLDETVKQDGSTRRLIATVQTRNLRHDSFTEEAFASRIVAEASRLNRIV